MDEQAMYEALPRNKRQEFDRLRREQEDIAQDLRKELTRFESLSDAYETAVKRETARPVGAGQRMGD